MTDRIGKVIANEENTKVGDVYDIIDVDNGNRFYYNEILVSNCAFIDESNILIDYETLQKLSKKSMVLNLFLNIKVFNFWFRTNNRIPK